MVEFLVKYNRIIVVANVSRQIITQSQAEELFKVDLENFAAKVEKYINMEYRWGI